MNKKIKIILFIVIFLINTFAIYIIFRPKTTSVSNPSQINTNLSTISQKDLGKYNGDDPTLPIYIALDGNVYDVTEGKVFYEPGGAYHYLAGKDSSLELKLFGADIIKRKYPIVAVLVK